MDAIRQKLSSRGFSVGGERTSSPSTAEQVGASITCYNRYTSQWISSSICVSLLKLG